MKLDGSRAGLAVELPDSGPAQRTDWPAFEVGAMDIPGARVVWCRGELDIASEERVVREIARALGTPASSIVLDLRELTFADCTALRCIEYAAAASERCNVTLHVDAGEAVQRLSKNLPPEMLQGAAPFL